jgi:hypothetical protein
MRKVFFLIGLIPCFLVLKTEAQNYRKTDYGIKTEISSVDVDIQFYNPEIVRILKSPAGISFKKESLSVIKRPEKINLKVSRKGDNVLLVSTALDVQLNMKTGKIRYFSRQGIPIVPLGPNVQYANEKSDPVEIRVYPGADGKFVLYDDEKDNYNYEKGMFATVEFKWNDKTKTLTIGDRKGSFPGMLRQRMFNIIIVGKNHGCGKRPTEKSDRTANYNGKQLVVKL